MSRRLELLNYIEKTLDKLGSSAEIDATELKKKVMPAVVKSIRGYLNGAPVEILNQSKAFLDESGVLPNFDADLNAFKEALTKIAHFIKSTLEESSQPAAAEPEDVNAQPEEGATEEAPEAGEEAEEATAPVEEEEEEKQPEEPPAPEAEDTEEQVAETPEAAPVSAEIAAPADAGPSAPADTAASKGSMVLMDYVTKTLDKLAKGAPPPQVLKEQVLPSVNKSLKGLCAGAPNDVRQSIKNVLDKHGVIEGTADVEGLKQSLSEIMDQVSGRAPKEDSSLEVAEETPAPARGKSQKGIVEPATAEHVRPPLHRQNTVGDRLRGISVQYLSTTLLDEVAEKGLTRRAKVYEIEPDIIRAKGEERLCPRDNEVGAAYVDCLDEGDAGYSTHMLSYTWGYEIGDISDSLMSFCSTKKLDPTRVFFWICCLCINQHRVKAAQQKKESIPFEKFKEEFAHRVSSIGHVVAMMAPWKDPSYTKRVWCDFEMYTASDLGIQVSVTMPPGEAHDMRDTLLSGKASNPELWKALQSVKIEEAQASVLEDKERILKLIEEGPGFHKLNSVVTKCIQDWVEKTCETLFDELDQNVDIPKEEKPNMAAHVGYVLRDMGKNKTGLRILQHAKDLFKQAGLFDTLEFCSLMSNVGVQKRRCDDLQGGLKDMEQARRTFVRLELEQTAEGAMMYNSLGAARRAKANTKEVKESEDQSEHRKLLSESHEAFTKAEDILRNLEMFETNEGASVMNSLGALNRQMGDIDEALRNFETAKGILEAQGEMVSPTGHVLMNSMGAAKKEKNDPKGALQAFEEMKHILERIGNFESDNGVQCLWQIALQKKRIRDFDGAKETAKEGQALCEKLLDSFRDPSQDLELRQKISETGDKFAGLVREFEGGKGKGKHDGKGKKGDGDPSYRRENKSSGKSSGGKGYQSKGKKDGGDGVEHGKSNKGKGKISGGKTDGGKGKSKDEHS